MNSFGLWGMFRNPQGSIVTACFAHWVLSRTMLNWRAPSSAACGAYGNDDAEVAG